MQGVSGQAPPRLRFDDAGSGAALYDFRHPTQLSREHVRVLQMAFDGFARRLTTLLTSGMRQVCQVGVIDISQHSYEDYVGGLNGPTLIIPITAHPLSGTCVLQFPLPVALACIDYMLGGPGGKQPVRTLTEIETGLLRGLLDQMVGVLRYSFESLVAMTPVIGAIEYNPQFVQAAAATDAMVIAALEMAVGHERGRATICLPLVPLLPLLIAQRPRGVSQDDELDPVAVRERLRQRLGHLEMDLSVEFRSVRLSPARVLDLSVGDVIRLDHKVGVPLTVRTAGTTFASAIAGRSGRRLAALVVDNPEETP